MQLTILVAALLSLMICIYYLSQGRLQIIAMLQGAGIFAIWHCHIAKLGQPDKRFSLYIMALSLLLVSLFTLLGALH